MTGSARTSPAPTSKPTRAQVNAARAITRWYLERHYGSSDDPGTAQMFFSEPLLGSFAIDRQGFERGDGPSIFKLLVATVMFQRRQDQQIQRVLRSIPEAEVEGLSSMSALLSLAERSACPHVKTLEGLLGSCDLGKDPVTKQGRCGARPDLPCHLKRHTELLKRYGHFGKVPTSLALALQRLELSDISALPAWARRGATPQEAAARLEEALCTSWRVSKKISSMFLSVLTNPDLTPGLDPPWREGVDWARFVVIDSNVDLALETLDYPGPWTYERRQAFIEALARAIDLSALRPGLTPYNPRIVQQALYLFMSKTNRAKAPNDCAHAAPSGCAQCPQELWRRCTITAKGPSAAPTPATRRPDP